MSDKQKVAPGFEFQVIVPGDFSIQQLREEAKKNYGLDIHIRAKLGPTKIYSDRRGITCDVTAIDDKILKGKFEFPIPAVGYCLYIGYFLPPNGE